VAISNVNCDLFFMYDFVVIFADSQVWYLSIGKGQWLEREVEVMFEAHSVDAEGQSGP